jgi:predicted lipase
LIEEIKKYPNYPLLIVGHSKGGALCEIAAVDLWHAGYKNITVFHYGAPRIGNEVWRNFVMKNFKRFFRVVNKRDIGMIIIKFNFSSLFATYDIGVCTFRKRNLLSK